MATRTETIRSRLEAKIPVELIVKEMGVTPSAVSKVAKKYGIVLPPRKRGPKPILDREPVHRLASQVGRDLFLFRQVHNDLTVRELATRLRLSVTNLQKGESGCYDFRLSEMIRISELLDKSLVELLTEQSVRIGHGPS
jgi:hypothetical protein